MIALLGWALAGTAAGVDGSVTVERPSRVVVLGGSLTETVYALGAGAVVAGVDASSTYPAEAQAAPQVGYYRQVGAEGVLSLRPDLVLALEEAGPPEAIAQLRAAGVPVLRLTGDPSVAGVEARTRAVATVLDRPADGDRMLAAFRRDLDAVHPPVTAPKVAFVFGRGAGSLTLAGRDTAADAMIQLAGGVNVVTGYQGYRPLTAEALVVAAPDVVVTTTGIVDAMGGRAAMLALPAIAATPAGQQQRLVVLDDLLLLGFGPRAGQGAAALAEALR
jgi:iron complex transport system substrate-binding protein